MNLAYTIHASQSLWMRRRTRITWRKKDRTPTCSTTGRAVFKSRTCGDIRIVMLRKQISKYERWELAGDFVSDNCMWLIDNLWLLRHQWLEAHFERVGPFLKFERLRGICKTGPSKRNYPIFFISPGFCRKYM